MRKTYPIITDFRATPPPVSLVTAMRLPEMSYSLMDNGIGCRIYHKPEMEIISLTVVAGGGAAEAKSAAKAALGAVMQREGSLHYSRDAISETLDYNGATLKSYISSHHTVHSLCCIKSRFAEVLPLFADLVCNPTYPDHELSIRRETLAKNIEVSRENVAYLTAVESERQIMGSAHPLAHEDSPTSIREITAEELQSFHNRYTTTGNMSMFLCGNITPDIELMVNTAFAQSAAKGDILPLTIQSFTPEKEGTKNVIIKPKSSQSSVVISLPAIERTHPDYLPLHLTVYALGGYFGSRLMLNIREEKGLTYGIDASMPGYIDDAYINISAETGNSNVTTVIEEVRREMQRLTEDPPEGDELIRMKQSALSSQAAVLDSPLTITDHYVTALTQGLPEGYFDAKQRAIESITPEIISTMAARYLRTDQIRIAIAGNPK